MSLYTAVYSVLVYSSFFGAVATMQFFLFVEESVFKLEFCCFICCEGMQKPGHSRFSFCKTEITLNGL